MLRGINIGPHKRMKMDKLRSSLESAGLEDVTTYIQSGNIVFRAAKFGDRALAGKIGDAIQRDFGFSADVVTRTRDEMGRIIENNPLLRERGIDESSLHVLFLSDPPAPASWKKLAELTRAPDRVRNLDREIYCFFPNGVSGSSLWKHPLDRLLTVTATMRNWATVNRLCQMARDLG